MFIQKLKKIKEDESGFSIIEIVVAMFILGLIMPAVVQMGLGSIQARDIATSNSKNVMGTAAINGALTNDIERAGAIKLDPNNGLSLRSSDGYCVSWKIENNQLLRAQSDIPINESSNWTPISENVKNPVEPAFEVKQNNFVSYKFNLGDEDSKLNIVGSAKQRVIPSGAGGCW